MIVVDLCRFFEIVLYAFAAVVMLAAGANLAFNIIVKLYSRSKEMEDADFEEHSDPQHGPE